MHPCSSSAWIEEDHSAVQGWVVTWCHHLPKTGTGTRLAEAAPRSLESHVRLVKQAMCHLLIHLDKIAEALGGSHRKEADTEATRTERSCSEVDASRVFKAFFIAWSEGKGISKRSSPSDVELALRRQSPTLAIVLG